MSKSEANVTDEIKIALTFSFYCFLDKVGTFPFYSEFANIFNFPFLLKNGPLSFQLFKCCNVLPELREKNNQSVSS